MRTITLTEHEHRYLSRFLGGMLDDRTLLGSKFVHDEDGTLSELFYLRGVLDKVVRAERSQNRTKVVL